MQGRAQLKPTRAPIISIHCNFLVLYFKGKSSCFLYCIVQYKIMFIACLHPLSCITVVCPLIAFVFGYSVGAGEVTTVLSRQL